jgi:hypothetical protein
MSQATIIDLTELLDEEQRLHRALVTADSDAIVESVKAIAMLLPKLEESKNVTFEGRQRERARELAEKIRVFQHVNHEISNGTLRTLRVCTDILMGNNYGPVKEDKALGQTNLNVSA